MSNRNLTSRLTFVLSILVLTALSGCTGRATSLPESVIVTLPDGTQTEATLGAGVLALADTRWEFKQVYAGGQESATPFVTVVFGTNGELTAFENNTIATEIFGDTILFDGKRHETTQPGVTYTAGTFGAETSDANGFTFVGELNAYATVLGKVATATATADGTFDLTDPNTMTGTFAYDSEVLVDLPGVPADSFTDEFAYIAHRVE